MDRTTVNCSYRISLYSITFQAGTQSGSKIDFRKYRYGVLQEHSSNTYRSEVIQVDIGGAMGLDSTKANIEQRYREGNYGCRRINGFWS